MSGPPQAASAIQPHGPLTTGTTTRTAASTAAGLVAQRGERDRGVERSAYDAAVLPLEKVRELLEQLDSHQSIETEAAELIMHMANDFVDSVVTFSCRLARHRGADTLEARDVLLHLERNWNIRVPGIVSEDAQPASEASMGRGKPSEAHAKRIKAIKEDTQIMGRKRAKAARSD